MEQKEVSEGSASGQYACYSVTSITFTCVVCLGLGKSDYQGQLRQERGKHQQPAESAICFASSRIDSSINR